MNQIICQKCSTVVPGHLPVNGYGPEALGGLMLVAEAPGNDEVQLGKPLVGGAGKILAGMCRRAGLNLDDIYRTNIIKCRPPNNRTPNEQEISNCIGHLINEIQILRPRLIIAMGDVAAVLLTGYALGSGKELKARGLTKPCLYAKDIPVLLTYHPAYVFYNPNEYNTICWDLDKVLNPVLNYEENYIVNPTREQANDMLASWGDEIVSCDIEATGLSFFNDIMIGLSFCGKPGEAFCYTLNKQTPQRWQHVHELMKSDMPKCWQNGLFDRGFILQQFKYEVARCLWDTMDAHYAVWSDARYTGLDFLRSLHTNKDPYKSVYRKRTDAFQADGDDVDLGIYACRDADVTKQVQARQMKIMDADQIHVLGRVLKFDRIAIRMRNRGVRVDTIRLGLNGKDLLETVQKEEKYFNTQHGVNPNSPKQLAKLIYDVRGMAPLPKTKKKGGRSTNELTTSILKTRTFITEDIEVLTHLEAYRERFTAYSKYIEGTFIRINEQTGRIHADWKPTGTDTGRPACKDPNLLNVPKDLRNQYIAGEGKIFFIGDYKQIELFLGALFAGEYKLCKDITDGVDIHEQVLQMLLTVVDTFKRVDAKQGVFGVMYGVSAKSLAEGLKIPLGLAQKILTFVAKIFPKLHAYGIATVEEWSAQGYLQTKHFRRRKYCETPMQALNFKTQSGSMDVSIDAMDILEDAGFPIVINVYDEIVCEVPEEWAEQGEQSPRFLEFKEIMETSTPELWERFPVDARISHTWSEEKKDA